jgi:hypothetical protein
MGSEGLIMNTQDKSNLDKTPQTIEAPKAQTSRPTGGPYEIRIRGHLNSNWSEYLEGLEMRWLENGEMILFGPIVDQAALMGILIKLNRLNLTILSFKPMKKTKWGKNEHTNNQPILWVNCMGCFVRLVGHPGTGERPPQWSWCCRHRPDLGVLALVWGGLELAKVTLGLPFEISVFPVLLIVMGTFTLVRELAGNKDQKQEAWNDRKRNETTPMLQLQHPLQGESKAAVSLRTHPSLAHGLVAGLENLPDGAAHP